MVKEAVCKLAASKVKCNCNINTHLCFRPHPIGTKQNMLYRSFFFFFGWGLGEFPEEKKTSGIHCTAPGNEFFYKHVVEIIALLKV